MGMYTTVIHPKTGDPLQINTGNDSCDTYKVGDVVPWHKNDEPGDVDFGDGVYDGTSAHDGGDAWVIVKDHSILCVLEKSRMQGWTIEGLGHALDLHAFERSWWTESQWAEKSIRDAERKLKDLGEELIFLRTLVGKTDAEIKELREARLSAVMSDFIRHELGRESFARQIFPVKPA